MEKMSSQCKLLAQAEQVQDKLHVVTLGYADESILHLYLQYETYIN
jgi:hypothetical protein